jgi:hypothetical protein
VPKSIIKINYDLSLYYLVFAFDNNNKSAFADRFPDLQEIRINNNQISGVTPDIGPKLTLLEIQNNRFNIAGPDTFHVPDSPDQANNINKVKYYRLTGNAALSDHLGYYDDTVPGYWNNNNYNNAARNSIEGPTLTDFWISDTKLGIPNFKSSSIYYFAATSMEGYSTFENKATGEQLGDRFDDIRYQFFTRKNNIGNNNNNFKFLNCNRLTRISARDGNCFGPIPSFKGCAKLRFIEFGGYWGSSNLRREGEIYPSARTAMLNNNNVFVTKFTLATSLTGGGVYIKDVPSPLNYHEVTTYSNGDFVFEYDIVNNQWVLKELGSVIATADTLDTLFPWNAVWPTGDLVFSDFMTTDEDSPALEESIDLSAMPLDVFSSMTDGASADTPNPLELFAYNFDPIFFDNVRTVRRSLTDIRNDFKNNLEFGSTDNDGPAIFNNLYNLKRFAYESKGITEGKFPLFKINEFVGNPATPDQTYVADETLSLGNITISNNAFTGGWGVNGALKLHSDCSTALQAFNFPYNKFTGALGFKELFGGANSQTEFTKLKEVWGDNNQFTSFADADATKLPNLEKVWLSGSFNSAATTIPSFKNFTKLKVLDISNNYFESINVTDKTNLFEKCSNLEVLTLNNNNWDTVSVINIIKSIYNVYKVGNFKLKRAYLAKRNNVESDIRKRKYIDINDNVVELKNSGHVIYGVKYKVYPPAPKTPSLSIDLNTLESPRYDSSEELNQKEEFELSSPPKENGDPNFIVFRPNGIIQTNNDFEVQYFDSSEYNGLVNIRLKWDTLVNADDVTEDLDGAPLSPSEKAIIIKKEIDLNNNGSFDDSPNAAETIEIAKANITTAGGKSYYNFPIQLDDNEGSNVHTPIGRSSNGTNIKFTVYGQNDRKVGGSNISSTIIITIKDSSEA